MIKSTNVLVLTAIAGVVISAAAQEGVTLGVFGYTQVEKPSQMLNLVGNNFGDDFSTLGDLLPVDRFTGAAYFADADRVVIWSSALTNYTTFALFDDTAHGGTTIEWRDGNDFRGVAANPIIPCGSSFWIQSIQASIETNFFLSGAVVDDLVVTNSITSGLQLIAYPFSMTVDLNSTALKNYATGAAYFTDADRVIAWDVENQTYATFALFDDTAYGGNTIEWRSGDDFRNPSGSIQLNIGQGFWYDAKAGFDWIETNKYYSSL